MRRSMVFEGVAVTLLILLIFLLLAMLLNGVEGSQIPAIGQISYTYVGPGNMLYVFSGVYYPNYIQAIDANGRQAWSYTIPQGWELSYDSLPIYYYSDGSSSGPFVTPLVASGNGIFYVCLSQVNGSVNDHAMNVTLMAFSSKGQVLWTLPVESCAIPIGPGNSTAGAIGDVEIQALGNRVYVFHNFNETVVDSNGTVLWNVANVSDPAAVDENGYVYLVKSRPAAGGYNPNSPADNTPESWLPSPSSTIDAYYPNGTLYWENYTSDLIQDQQTFLYYVYQSSEPYTMPIYHDGLLYAPTVSGMSVFYPNGTVKWEKTFSPEELKLDFPATLYVQPSPIIAQETASAKLSLYDMIPFDDQGNVYMEYQNGGTIAEFHKVLLLTLDSNGNLISSRDISNNSTVYQYVNDGAGYDFNGPGYGINDVYNTYLYGENTGKVTNLTDMLGVTLNAYDIKSGNGLWSYNIIATNASISTMTLSNIGDILSGTAAQQAINDYGTNVSYAGVQPTIGTEEYADMVFGSGTIYVSFQECNYEYPITFGESKAAYSSGIYALTYNGSLLWYQPVGAQVSNIQPAQNGTVFYQTPDGKIGVTGSGIAAGFTVTALAYLFLRFVCVGAVARAKARLNKNGNRLRVMDFITANPGCTLYEISRGTGVNLGTVRYHLFILGMNRKTVASSIDGKYIRYFTNSNTYSREEQLIISLFRRDTVGKILGLLARRPGISNVEIAGEVGIPESITSRYLKELAERGVVRNSASGRERAYSIDESYSAHVAEALKRLGAPKRPIP